MFETIARKTDEEKKTVQLADGQMAMEVFQKCFGSMVTHNHHHHVPTVNGTF